jgi:murein L,D-transpeptidase YcbB/YkuD
LNHFSTSSHIDREDFEIPLQKKDSLSAWNLAKKVLRNKKFLVSDTTHAEIAALRNFQQFSNQKVDGVIGESTAQLLGESSYSKVLRACLTLEKMRQRINRNKTFVWINIPEFKLVYVHDDTLRSENRVVVGTVKNQTPELKSLIHSIVVLPYWNVPYSIASKEILPALQRNPNYLARNKMILFQKKVEIDPTTINWKKYKVTHFPFQVRQEPGSHNSLGIIKFEFHNKFSVYVHDSPAKSLFGTINRSYSHGCIRCENPVELGKLMLTLDENAMTADSLDSLYARNLHTFIPLKKRIPIFIEYYTVTLNEQGDLLFLRDLYRKEDEIITRWRTGKE